MPRQRDTSILGIPGYVFYPGAGRWLVRSPVGHVYYVDDSLETCTCPDFAARGKDRFCKHIEGLREFAGFPDYIETTLI